MQQEQKKERKKRESNRNYSVRGAIQENINQLIEYYNVNQLQPESSTSIYATGIRIHREIEALLEKYPQNAYCFYLRGFLHHTLVTIEWRGKHNLSGLPNLDMAISDLSSVMALEWGCLRKTREDLTIVIDKWIAELVTMKDGFRQRKENR